MFYTCSCCKHVEFREWCRNYFCEIKKCYMYEGSKQCEHFILSAHNELEQETEGLGLKVH